jgi:transposase
MRDIRFSEDDQARIRKLRYNHPDPRALKRLEILTLFICGEKHERIACLAGCSRSTVGRVLTNYAEHGLDETLRFHEVGPKCELQKHRDCLQTELTNHPPRTISEAQDRIEHLTGIRRGSTQVRTFLRESLGFRWRKARSISVPPKKSVPEQIAIQKDFVEKELNPRLDEARQGKRTVFFVDSVFRGRFSHGTGGLPELPVEFDAVVHPLGVRTPAIQHLGGNQPFDTSVLSCLQYPVHQQ